MQNINKNTLEDNPQKFENVLGYPKFSATVPIQECCEELISTTQGVYFFHDIRGIHYIGESTNIRSRFKTHLRKNKKLVSMINSAFGKMYLSWVKTDTYIQALIFEKKWVRLLQPKINKITFKSNK